MALDAFVRRDDDQADRVLASDDEVDRRCAAIIATMTACMSEHPGEVPVRPPRDSGGQVPRANRRSRHQRGRRGHLHGPRRRRAARAVAPVPRASPLRVRLAHRPRSDRTSLMRCGLPSGSPGGVGRAQPRAPGKRRRRSSPGPRGARHGCRLETAFCIHRETKRKGQAMGLGKRTAAEMLGTFWLVLGGCGERSSRPKSLWSASECSASRWPSG